MTERLGPRHIGALRGIANAEYTGIGMECTFRGTGGPSIPWRLMSGLIYRNLVSVTAKEVHIGTLRSSSDASVALLSGIGFSYVFKFPLGHA